MSTISSRLSRLRECMRKRKLDAWVVLSGDPHLSEYLPKDWAFRRYLTGFTGSAGSLVVTPDKALLWTDSRYWEQAQEEIEGCGIELMRQGLADVPEITDWLVEHLEESSTVGLDAHTISMHCHQAWEVQLAAKDIRLVSSETMMSCVWSDRPKPLSNPVFAFEYGQLSRKEKFALIARELDKVNAFGLFLTSLDDVAWIMNLRGSDIKATPVFTAYALVHKTGAVLYIDPKKIPDKAVHDALKSDGIKIVDIKRIGADLKSQLRGRSVLLDTHTTAQAMYLRLIEEDNIDIIRGANPVELLKSRKTPQELDLLRETMRRDGAALCELFAWLEAELRSGSRVTELDVSAKLLELRKAQPGFLEISFATIAAAGVNAALPHYCPRGEKNADVSQANVLLLDSGGQYTGGTTDITRTVLTSVACPELKRDYTAVLRGHIALANSRFPAGVFASQLDTLARAPLWQINADYGHGTGHGVGFCLSVHEGPVHISPRCPAEDRRRIVKGLVLSNEPGLYRPGRWGIRTENLVTPVSLPTSESETQSMMQFETLSLCPIDTRLIEKNMMTAAEVDWLNAYHRRVREELSPLVSADTRTWLEKATREI